MHDVFDRVPRRDAQHEGSVGPVEPLHLVPGGLEAGASREQIVCRVGRDLLDPWRLRALPGEVFMKQDSGVALTWSDSSAG